MYLCLYRYIAVILEASLIFQAKKNFLRGTSRNWTNRNFNELWYGHFPPVPRARTGSVSPALPIMSKCMGSKVEDFRQRALVRSLRDRTVCPYRSHDHDSKIAETSREFKEQWYGCGATVRPAHSEPRPRLRRRKT